MLMEELGERYASVTSVHLTFPVYGRSRTLPWWHPSGYHEHVRPLQCSKLNNTEKRLKEDSTPSVSINQHSVNSFINMSQKYCQVTHYMNVGTYTRASSICLFIYIVHLCNWFHLIWSTAETGQKSGVMQHYYRLVTCSFPFYWPMKL